MNISEALQKVKLMKLPSTRGNMLICCMFAFNMNGVLARTRLLCQKYPKFKHSIDLIDFVVNILNTLYPVACYDPKKNEFNYNQAQKWVETNKESWEILSGTYSHFRTQIKKFPNIMDYITKKDKAWINDNLDKILEAEVFQMTNGIIRQALLDKSIAINDQNDIWNFLEVIFENMGIEDILISETKFI